MRHPVSERALLATLREELSSSAPALEAAHARAVGWVTRGRAAPSDVTLLERVLEDFPLDSAPGKALMSLAEALLRTPDSRAADVLISERLRALSVPNRAESERSMVSAFALAMLRGVGTLLRNPDPEAGWAPSRLSAPLVAPIARRAARLAIRTFSDSFIAGESIESALARGARDPALALCSYDMLGEGARTAKDAARYLRGYQAAIEALARQSAGTLEQRCSTPVKR